MRYAEALIPSSFLAQVAGELGGWASNIRLKIEQTKIGFLAGQRLPFSEH